MGSGQREEDGGLFSSQFSYDLQRGAGERGQCVRKVSVHYSMTCTLLLYLKNFIQVFVRMFLFTSSFADCNTLISSHENDTEEVSLLEEQLREQDLALTDIRLEALTSAHQLESLKETINKMRSEMISLKQDNERLQRIVANKSLTSSQSSLSASEADNIGRSVGSVPLSSLIDVPNETLDLENNGDLLFLNPLDKNGKKVDISVYLDCHGEYDKYINPVDGSSNGSCVIGALSISNRTKWDVLDGFVRRIFKDYLLRLDPISGLGLSIDSLKSYHLGEAIRSKDVDVPNLLPCGYLIGDVTNITLVLRGATSNCVDALAFETLIPKSIVQRYVSLLTEHRRVILCGPPGT